MSKINLKFGVAAQNDTQNVRRLSCVVLFALLVFCFTLMLRSSLASAQNTADVNLAGQQFDGSVPVVFGVVPQQSPARLAKLWSPFLNELSRSLGRQVRFATAADIPTFEERLGTGLYDIAYVNPAQYVRHHRGSDYHALARVGAHQLQGIIVVAKDFPGSTLSDLDRAEVAFPAPTAFGASILTQSDLIDANVRFEPRYVKSHDSVFRSVALGLIAAGGGVPRTLARMPDHVIADLRVLHKTRKVSPHAFTAHARIPLSQRVKIANALTEIHKTSDGAVAAKLLGFKPIIHASDADWNDVRDLLSTLEEHRP